MTISFVVPAYNRAHVIGRCLTSIFGCSPEFVAEVVVVDDGSKDDLDSVVCAWQQKMPGKIVFLRTKRNMGVSCARNLAFPHLTGDYVWFVDSDDVVFSSGVTRMMRLVDRDKPDIYRFSWLRVRGEGRGEESPAGGDAFLPGPRSFDMKRCSGGELKILYRRSLLCNALYKRSLLSSDVVFRNGLSNGEDRLFATEALIRAKTVLLDENNVAYGYTVTSGSASDVPTAKMFRNYIRASCELVSLFIRASTKDRRWRSVLEAEIWNYYPRILCPFGKRTFHSGWFRLFRAGYHRIFVDNPSRNGVSRVISWLVWTSKSEWIMRAESRSHGYFSGALKRLSHGFHS